MSAGECGLYIPPVGHTINFLFLFRRWTLDSRTGQDCHCSRSWRTKQVGDIALVAWRVSQWASNSWIFPTLFNYSCWLTSRSRQCQTGGRGRVSARSQCDSWWRWQAALKVVWWWWCQCAVCRSWCCPPHLPQSAGLSPSPESEDQLMLARLRRGRGVTRLRSEVTAGTSSVSHLSPHRRAGDQGQETGDCPHQTSNIGTCSVIWFITGDRGERGECLVQ